jgi:hypothetical protein
MNNTMTAGIERCLMSLDFTPPPSCYLPDEWWSQRPVLRHIRQAAHSRRCGADGVLAVVACRVMALVDYRWQIPPIVGAPASLNLMCGLIAPSGFGKSSTNTTAEQLVPFPDDMNIAYRPIGSGEGIAATYVGTDGNKADGELLHRSVMFYCDEGSAFAKIEARVGSLFASELRKAAHGAMIGQQNGNKATTRTVKAHQYRMVFVIGFQPTNAGPFIANDSEGTPQRLIWATPFDPEHAPAPGERPDWPGQLHIKPSTPSGDCFVSFTKQICDEVDWNDYARKIGDTTESATLDSHRDLERLRMAAVLATLDGRVGNVTDEDYEMATQWSSASAALRDYALEWWNESQIQTAHTKASAMGVLADVAGASRHEHGLERIARKIANSDHMQGTTAKQPWVVTGQWAGRDHREFKEAIAYGVERGWFKARGVAVYVND